MVTEVVMTVWIRLGQGSEKVKDQDVDEAHGKSEGVYSKGGLLHVEKERFVILRDDCTNEINLYNV